MKLAIPMIALLAAGPAGAGAEREPLRDPFVRPGTPATATAATTGATAAGGAADPADADRPEPAQPRLHAILFSRAQALADIDGLVLREGDHVGDWRIMKIEERRVSLKRGDAALVLRFDREKTR
jgi:pyruvate/2-oxoglutarate dehydrogenase complex dihydrolipoamide acyltransferase (E2) component